MKFPCNRRVSTIPKRMGYIMQKVLTFANCLQAVDEGTKALKRTPEVVEIREHRDEYAQKILEILINGWVPGPTRTITIYESMARKTRTLTLTTKMDHLIHVAIMLPIIPVLMRRFDKFSCGSIPGRGSKQVYRTMKNWTRPGKAKKYWAEADIHHAFQNTSHELVMQSLRRFIKDEAYLHLHELILQQMGAGIAIGFSPSHWYFNLVMDEIDKKMRERFRGLRYIRYMDNIVMSYGRKRTLHRVLAYFEQLCRDRGFSLNHSKQVYPLSKRPVTFLSYRYFGRYSLIRKPTMYRMTKAFKLCGRHMCAHHCRTAISLLGITRHCNSYNYRIHYVYPVVSIKQMKGLISNDDKKRNLRLLTRLLSGHPDREDEPVLCGVQAEHPRADRSGNG